MIQEKANKKIAPLVRKKRKKKRLEKRFKKRIILRGGNFNLIILSILDLIFLFFKKKKKSEHERTVLKITKEVTLCIFPVIVKFSSPNVVIVSLLTCISRKDKGTPYFVK